MIEIMAAIDDDNAKPREQPQNNIVPAKNILSQKEEKITELENKVSNIENLLEKVLNAVKPEDKNMVTDKKEDDIQQAQVYQLLYNNLLKNEVDEEIAKSIMERVTSESNSTCISDASMVMHSVIASMLGKAEPINLRKDGKPTVILFIGPTGVGKTTTLAKLAATFMLSNNKKVGFITADTYRIAAVEQLKTYAEILGIPISVAYSVFEISNEIQRYSDKDIILIDTAGCSHRDKQKFEELKKLVNACEADNIFLVLSTTVSSKNCKEIIKNYDFIENYRLIFTKLDETPVYGSILNTKFYANRSLSYMTNGQNVPDDIEIANIDRLSKNLLGTIS